MENNSTEKVRCRLSFSLSKHTRHKNTHTHTQLFGKYSFMKAQRALVLLWLHVRIVDLRDPFRTPVMRMSSLVRNMVQQEILLISFGFLTLESWQRKSWSRNPGDTLRIGSSIRTTRKKKTLPCYFFPAVELPECLGPVPLERRTSGWKCAEITSN